MKKGMVYLQSGGPTAVINCSLLGAISEAKKHQDKISNIYGSHFGVEGLLNDDLISLDHLSDDELSLFKQTPGAILGSSRHKVKDGDEEIILKTLLKHDIGYVFVNGGNDSMDTCNKLSEYISSKGIDIKVVGVPKTIDNDLVLTDHTPGFASSAKCIINTVKSLVIDTSCYQKGKVIIVEVMGRDTGWNAASVDILEEPYRPDLIYFRENKFKYKNFLTEITNVYRKKNYCICVISEGIEVHHSDEQSVDEFGHHNFDGASIELTKMAKKDTGINMRSISLSIPTRCASNIVSVVDQKEAFDAGAYAINIALQGISNVMVNIVRDSFKPYASHFEYVQVKEVANRVRLIPSEFIVDHTRMSNSFRDYMRPLIDGDADIKYTNGIFDTFSLK